MIAMLKQAERHDFGPLRQKLKTLGIESNEEVDAVLRRLRVRTVDGRTDDIIAPGKSRRHSTVLIGGVACLYERLADGNRQIYSFQYPGDFCDLYRHVLPETNKEVAVAAITACSIGIIDHDDLEQLILKYPSVGRALWRATVVEASIFRKRLLNVGRQPALQRVAHLLCEQLARQEAVGIDNPVIPLCQLDVADAVGLSFVHVNRTFKELQRLGFLAKQGRSMKVTNREQLVRLAGFDSNYLNIPPPLSRWELKITGTSMRPGPSASIGVPRPPALRLRSKVLSQGQPDSEEATVLPLA